MSRNLFLILRRLFLFGCANAALVISAQESLQQQQNTDDFINHPWRLEHISPDDDWTRHFRLGGVAGLNIKGNFKMNSGSFLISGNNPANGIYDDGYVRTDDTGNAPYNGQPATSYWGYQNSSQYDSGANTLTMHSATSFSTTSGSSGSANDSVSPGLDLAYGDSYWYWDHAKLGWEFGFGSLPIHLSSSSTMSGSVSSTAYTFQFPTGPNGPVIPPDVSPGNPYNGPASGIGPLLYFNSTPGGSSSIPGATINNTESLDVMLYTARLGPAMYWDISERIGAYASAGPAVGLVSGNLEYRDAITYNPTYPTSGPDVTAHSHGQINGTGVVYGGYVNATLVYHAVEGGDFYLGAQFMPLNSATISGGGRSGKLDLSGQVYITAGINWPF
ncbi:MAG TPA: hypothetical protein VE344_09210 [Methylomirabilota bacterium]|nr:hypothetical protein [Methylomirabilota bacterium]